MSRVEIRQRAASKGQRGGRRGQEGRPAPLFSASWSTGITLIHVRQSSFLGPILFLAYINDLPDQVKSCVRLFADDTAIYLATYASSKRIPRTLKGWLGLAAVLCILRHWGIQMILAYS